MPELVRRGCCVGIKAKEHKHHHHHHHHHRDRRCDPPTYLIYPVTPPMCGAPMQCPGTSMPPVWGGVNPMDWME